MTFAKGIKTYVICAIGVGLGVYQALLQAGVHLPPIPGFAIWILGFAGLGAARNGITTDTQKAVSDILNQIMVQASAPTDIPGLAQAPSVASVQHFATSKNSTA